MQCSVSPAPENHVCLSTLSVLDDIALRGKKNYTLWEISFEVIVLYLIRKGQSDCQSIFRGKVSAVIDFERPFFDLIGLYS